MEATLVGLGLALIVFALQSGATSPSLRRDLALSLSFPAAVNMGLLLTVVTGVALAFNGDPFGDWLGLAVGLGAALWTLALFASVSDAIAVADPVGRIKARRSRLLRATRELLRRELLRNVGTSLLESEVGSAGGEFSALLLPREGSGGSVVRAARDGQIVDVNLPRLVGTVRHASGSGIKSEVWLRLWEQVVRDTPIGQAARGSADQFESALQRSMAIAPAKATGDLRLEIERLHVEARMSVGPDTTALDAVLEAFDAVLEAYALGWRRYVPVLTPEHISVFLEGSGVPLDAIQRAVYDLTEAALQGEALDALRTLLFYPAHLVAKSVDWMAPAYLRIAQLPQHTYVAIATSDASTTMRRRVAELPWLYLVETLEFSLRTRDKPYVAEPDYERLADARWAIRRGLVGVLRRAVQHSDLENFKEGLRRWRIAEEHHDTSGVPLAAKCPIPLPWEIVRRQSAGQLHDAGAWLRAAAQGVSVTEVVAAVDTQLSQDDRLADLGEWVSVDLPSHEVHVIDYQSDLLRAMFLIVALNQAPGRPISPFKIRSHMYGIRDQVAQIATEIKDRAADFEAAYDIDQLSDRVDAFADAIARAVTEYEKEERDRIRSTPLDAGAAMAFRVAVREAVADSAFRAELSLIANSEVVTTRPPRRTRLVSRQLVEKLWFVRPDQTEGARSIGEMFGRGLTDAETRRFAQALSVGRPVAFGTTSVTRRILAAIEQLAAAGHTDFAVLIPQRWELTSVLEGEGDFARSWGEQGGVLGSLAGHPVYDLGDWGARWGAVITQRGAVLARQFVQPDSHSIDVDVAEVDETRVAELIAEGISVDGDVSESMIDRLRLRVLVHVSEAIEFHVDPTQVVRVALPSDAPRRH